MDTRSDWIFLSKRLEDEYINAFAQGCGSRPINSETFDYAVSRAPIVLRGIMKHKIMKQCWQDGRDFYYMDTGYFGNDRPDKKLWHRIVKNDLQHGDIVTRPADRWTKLGRSIVPRRQGRRIIVAAPDDKPCIFYGIDRDAWLEQVCRTLRSHTDRPIEVRQRDKNRNARMFADPLSRVLADDVHALVTFNSVAASEAVLNGVPAFVLAPANAARPVANTDLAQIENPYYPDRDKLMVWCHHLAYGQFHLRELRDGRAFHILTEQ
jgi:hypothetical protein